MALAVGGSIIGSISRNATSNTTTTQASGSVIVVATCFTNAQTIVHLADSKGNTYVPITGLGSNGMGGSCALWYCSNAVGGTNHSWTVYYDGFTPCLLMAAEVTGWTGTGTPDQTVAWLYDNATPHTSNTTGTTTAADEMALAFLQSNGSSAETFTWGGGFTVIASQTASIRGSFASQLLSSAQTVQSSVTLGNGTAATSTVVTLKEYVSSPSTPLFYVTA